MAKYYILAIISITLFIAALLKPTFAFFTDSGEAQNNTFTEDAEFPTQIQTPSDTPSAELIVINEVQPNGNGDDEWVELLNKSAGSIDISGWIISDVESSDTIPTTAPIPAGGYVVIRGNGSTVSVPGSAITITLSTAIGNALNANNEGLNIKKPDNTVIDAVNWGSINTFFNPSISSSGLDAGETFSRNPNGQDTDTATDWVINSTPSIGVAN